MWVLAESGIIGVLALVSGVVGVGLSAAQLGLPRKVDLVPAIVRVARPGDIVITLGAGSIGAIPDRLMAALGERTRPGPPTGGAS